MFADFIILLYSSVMLLSLIVLVALIYLRRAPRSLYFTYMMLCIFVFTLGYVFEISSQNLTGAMLAARIQYLGITFIGSLQMLFVLEYCGIQIRKAVVIGIFTIPLISLVLMQTYPLQLAYYRNVEFFIEDGISHLRVTGGVFYYIFFLYQYIAIITSLLIILYFYKKRDAIFRRQYLILLAAELPPVIGNIIGLFGITFFHLDLTPIFMALSCSLLAYLISRLGMYRIVPIAREKIVETMRDGFVLMDMQDQFIDANDAAKRLFPQLNNASVGIKMSNINDIPWHSVNEGSEKSEFSIVSSSGDCKYFRVSETLISIRNKNIGRSLIIYDITESQKLLEKVTALAEFDALTGLYNKGTLHRMGNAMFHDVVQSTNSACLLMMDIDFFKDVNDTYGHLKGDEVLKTIARILSSRLRSRDLLARFGGEEFCAFLQDISEQDVLKIAETMRRNVELMEIQSDDKTLRVTISIGVSVYTQKKHPTFESLIADADLALYSAKNNGRNRIVIINK